MNYHQAARKAATGDAGDAGDDDLWESRDTAAEAGKAKVSYYVHTAPLREEMKRGRLDDPDFLKSLDDTMESAGRNLALDAGRLAESGGRDALAEARENDAEVIGWYRMTDTDPCGFCAMLASRGAAYSKFMEPDQFHRGCHCQTLPLFRGVSMPPEDAAKRDEYLARFKATPGSGSSQARAFQEAFDTERKARRDGQSA
ncbi:hypothetical protein [Streptomyces sp. ISL-100]|uniref:VG15 protein n=1 Tax=Streptomyces sp. ISL-100 TaxID=2819173 RepID=UPI001BE97330|nr:hypothetical protein [Streptomyces sp. ISL-100]MBT2400267.1 hypothetical protein [Streptomyces sp. ISL-100]